MRFAHPHILWLFWLLPLFVLLLAQTRARAWRRLAEFTGDSLRAELTASVDHGRRRWRATLRVLALALLIFAAARPQWGASEVEVQQKGIDLVVALDVSRSMLAEDIQPNRLFRAKAELGELIDGLDGDRIGLVFFAGAAFPQCPVTVDYPAARLFLSQADPSMISAQGTDIGSALDVALSLFDTEEGRHRVILLVTDGEDFAGGVEEAARKLRQSGVVLHGVGIGTPGGAPMPSISDAGRREGFVRDPEGNVAMSRLEEGPLLDLARSTGGIYLRAGTGGIDVPRLRSELDAVEGRSYSEQRVVSYQERFAIPLLAAMLLLAAEAMLSDRVRRRRRES
jgi:Ca-activated chloride channel homolog